MTQCSAKVWRRDQLRRTGRTKSGFETEYAEGRCRRRALEGDQVCKQHAEIRRRQGGRITTCDFAEETARFRMLGTGKTKSEKHSHSGVR